MRRLLTAFAVLTIIFTICIFPCSAATVSPLDCSLDDSYTVVPLADAGGSEEDGTSGGGAGGDATTEEEDTSMGDTIIERVTTLFSPLIKFFDGLSNLFSFLDFESVGDFFDSLTDDSPLFDWLGDDFVDDISSFYNGIGEMFTLFPAPIRAFVVFTFVSVVAFSVLRMFL